MGSRPRAQSPSSVNKTSQWQLACVFCHVHPALRCGYKRRARANAQQLGIPLALPHSSSSGFRRATSAHGQGDLRITVRASPSSTSLRASHSSKSHHLAFPRRARGVLGQGGAQHLVRSTSRWQDVDRCIAGWARFWRWRFGSAASVRKSSVARVRSRTSRTVERPKVMWRSPQSSALLTCSSDHKAQPPGEVIYAFRPGPVSFRPL